MTHTVRVSIDVKGQVMPEPTMEVRNPEFRRYLETYTEREADFLGRVSEFGLEFEQPPQGPSPAEAYRDGECPRAVRPCALPATLRRMESMLKTTARAFGVPGFHLHA